MKSQAEHCSRRHLGVLKLDMMKLDLWITAGAEE